MIAMFALAQAAALLICSRYEIPLQKRLRSLLVQPRGAIHVAPPPHRHLPLVVRDNPELARSLQAALESESEVTVVDRRLGERRRSDTDVASERRRADRRAALR